jgi:hypothetical protein
LLIYCLPEWWQKEMDGVEKKNLKIKKNWKTKLLAFLPILTLSNMPNANLPEQFPHSFNVKEKDYYA